MGSGRSSGNAGVAQVVIGIHQRNHFGRSRHAVGPHSFGVALAIHPLMVLGDHQLRPTGQAHARRSVQPQNHMLPVGPFFDRCELVRAPAQAVWQRLLANVMQQRTDANVVQGGVVELHRTA